MGLQRNPQPRGKFSDDELREVATAARTAYHVNRGDKVTLDQLDRLCSLSRGKIAQIISTDLFVDVMTASGIQWKMNKGLTAQQHYCLMIMTDPTDRRKFDVRLRDAGISSTTYRSWMRQPLFASIVEQFAEAALGDHMSQAHNSLMRQVDNGSVPALNLYYAMTGRYAPGSQQERDMNAVIMQIIEIITRNVANPHELQRISDEMQELLGNKQKSTPKTVRSEIVPDTMQELEDGKYRVEIPEFNAEEFLAGPGEYGPVADFNLGE